MFLFYALAVDSSMLATVGTLASQQSRGTRAIMVALVQLLNYAATHPDVYVLFKISDVTLHVSSDVSYLSAPKARSRSAGYHYLSDRPRIHPNHLFPMTLSPLQMVPSTSTARLCAKCCLSSAAEAELATLFHNGKEACPLRACLQELGHPQPPTSLQTDNSTASGIANDSVKQKRS
jgi:hypothetical protein